MAIIFDSQGQAWTYDDDTVKKGLPKEHRVPLLMFYERVQTEAPEKNIHFASLQQKAQGKTNLQLSSPINVSPSLFTGEEGAWTIVTKAGRQSHHTNFWKPGQEGTSKPKNQATPNTDFIFKKDQKKKG